MGFILISTIFALLFVGFFVLRVFVFGADQSKGASEARVVTGVGAFLTLCIYLFVILPLNIVIQPEEGYVRFYKQFGTVVETPYTAGLQFVTPWYTQAAQYDVRNQIIEFSGDRTLRTQFKGGVEVDRFDLNVPYRVNEQFGWAIVKHIGEGSLYKEQIRNAARAAARNVANQWEWEQALNVNQAGFVDQIRTRLEVSLADRLIKQGVAPEVAQNMFIFSTPEVRRLLPPKVVREQGAEREAAKIEQERQRELTVAEREIALRQKEFGEGLKNIFDGLGVDASDLEGEDLVRAIEAVAKYKMADALEKMSRREDNPVKWGVIISTGSGNAPSVALPRPQ